MRALDRKLLRDVAGLKAQAGAVALVLAAGVALFVGMTTMYRSVRQSQSAFYTQARFAHLWVGLGRAPLSVARELERLPGVVAVDARLTTRAILDVPGLLEPASAVLVSVPGEGQHRVNDLHVRRGRHVEPGRPGEVLVSEAFAERNHLVAGDALTAVVAGQRTTLQIVGVALSPEHVMPIEPGTFLPDEQRFAVLWMPRAPLAALLDMQGSFNDVAVRLSPGADEPRVIAGLDRILAPYGGRGAFGRRSQGSHVMLEEHLKPLKPLTLLVPAIFLVVSALLAHVVLGRLVARQHDQIGMLKAFGYSNGRIAAHYVEFGLAIVLVGAAVGVPGGVWLGRILARFYADFFRFPVLVLAIEPVVLAGGVTIAVMVAVVGVLGAVRRVVAMPPTVAMTAVPPAFRDTRLDRAGVIPVLSAPVRMMVRNLTKRPLRSALSSVGMALAIAVVILGRASGDSFDRMRDVQFQSAQRADVSLTLAHPRAVGTITDALGLPGVTRAEPYRLVPARLLVRGSYEDITLVGLPDGGVLRRVVDTDFGRTPIRGTGVILTTWTARRLGLSRGDLLSIEIRERRRRVVTARLAGVVDEPLGEQGYMELGALGRLLAEPETYSGVNLAIDPARERELYAVLKQVPAVVAIDLRSGVLASYRAMSDAAVEFTRRILVLFAVIIAFGVVYNTARITVAERERELATLRVLGFTRREVSVILLGEIALLAAPAIPLGLAMGYGLASAATAAMTGSLFHVPLLVLRSTYAFAILVFVAAAIASALVVRQRLDRLDLLGALKARV